MFRGFYRGYIVHKKGVTKERGFNGSYKHGNYYLGFRV